MLAVIGAEPLLRHGPDGFAPRPQRRPLTRFERLGLEQGHVVRDVIAYRI
jgi:tRNA (guanine-N7-)-methyltransferase